MTSTPAIRLQRDGNGGYRTTDGRFTLTPVAIGGGALTTRGGDNSGWSNGHREWALDDTTGRARFGVGGHCTVVDTLWRAREIITTTVRLEG